MISPPTMRVDVPHDVVWQSWVSPLASRYVMSKTLAKFWPRSWLVPICRALPSPIIASQASVLMAPGKRSAAVLRPVSTGMASTLIMKSAYTSRRICSA